MPRRVERTPLVSGFIEFIKDNGPLGVTEIARQYRGSDGSAGDNKSHIRWASEVCSRLLGEGVLVKTEDRKYSYAGEGWRGVSHRRIRNRTKLQRGLIEYVKVHGPVGPKTIAIEYRGVGDDDPQCGSMVTWASKTCQKFVQEGLFGKVQGGQYYFIGMGSGVFARMRREDDFLFGVREHLKNAMNLQGLAANALQMALYDFKEKSSGERVLSSDIRVLQLMETIAHQSLSLESQLAAIVGTQYTMTARLEDEDYLGVVEAPNIHMIPFTPDPKD